MQQYLAELYKWHPMLASAITFVLGGGGIRVVIYVAKKLPPLPKNAGWWAQFGYALVQGLSGLDPNASIVPPWDGTTERRLPRP